MTNELWNQWSDCHSSPDQEKRIASAKKSACTPVFLDQTSCTGTFKGSSGTHTTALDRCSCVDFNRRRLPCKHMYRLAMELSIFHSDFKSDTSAIIEPGQRRETISETVKRIETLSNDDQRLLLQAIRDSSGNNSSACYKSSSEIHTLIDAGLFALVDDNAKCLSKYKKAELIALANSFELAPDKKMLKSELIKYIIENTSNEQLSGNLDYIVIQPNPRIKHGKIKMYLHRKFESECISDPCTGNILDVPLLSTELPDDDVTALLTEYGYYKPQ